MRTFEGAALEKRKNEDLIELFTDPETGKPVVRDKVSHPLDVINFERATEMYQTGQITEVEYSRIKGLYAAKRRERRRD